MMASTQCQALRTTADPRAPICRCERKAPAGEAYCGQHRNVRSILRTRTLAAMLRNSRSC